MAVENGCVGKGLWFGKALKVALVGVVASSIRGMGSG